MSWLSESHEFQDGTGKQSLLRSDRAHLKFGDPISCHKILKDLPSVFKVDSRTSDKISWIYFRVHKAMELLSPDVPVGKVNLDNLTCIACGRYRWWLQSVQTVSTNTLGNRQRKLAHICKHQPTPTTVDKKGLS
jgi:hypothetical protein